MNVKLPALVIILRIHLIRLVKFALTVALLGKLKLKKLKIKKIKNKI
jgi:hypothetical protein